MSSPDAPRPTDAIRGYHAHIYYDPTTRDTAARVRGWIEERFDVRLGRWHDQPVGPHVQAMFQVAFAPELFAAIVPWLALNHSGLSVLVHPETGHDLADHTEHALWIGAKLAINEAALG